MGLLGAVALYDQTSISETTWYDKANGNDGAVTGASVLNYKGAHTDGVDLLVCSNIMAHGDIGLSWVYDGATEGGIGVGAGLVDSTIYAEGSGSAGIVLYDSGGSANLQSVRIVHSDGSTRIEEMNTSGSIRLVALSIDHATNSTALFGYLGLQQTDTDSAVKGDVWYDASENKLKFFNGTAVETVTSS
jgi:hypothetical protein